MQARLPKSPFVVFISTLVNPTFGSIAKQDPGGIPPIFVHASCLEAHSICGLEARANRCQLSTSQRSNPFFSGWGNGGPAAKKKLISGFFLYSRAR